MKKIAKKVIVTMIIFLIVYLTCGIKLSLAETVKTMKIVIDPGHGGYESGAVNYEDGIIERDITLKTSIYLKEYLEDYYGVEVIMTHNGLASNQEMSVLDRAMCARNNNADLLLCLHYNSSPSGNDWNGAEVYVTNNTSCYKYKQESTEIGNLILNNLSNLGIAKRGVKTRLCQDSGPKWEYSDGTKADYYGIIRYAMKGNAEDRGPDITKGTGITSILIEHCFIQGQDVNFINTDAKLKKLAEADGKAIVEHYGLKLKKDVASQIILNKTNINMIVGEKTKVDVTVNPTTAINKKINWSSSNDKIAKVDQDGNITATGQGSAIIKAVADGNDKIYSEVKVSVTDTNISIQNGEKASMLVNEEMQLFIDTTNQESKILWNSNDETIATVSQDGIVKALKEGNAKITATLEKYNKTASIEISVNKLNEEESIKIEGYNEDKGILSNFAREKKAEDFAKNIKLTGNLKAKVSTDKFVGTGTKVEILRDSKVIKTYICKLYGDVNGDGKISVMDYVIVKNNILNVEKINEKLFRDAADVSNDGKISVIDYVIIKNDILGIEKI